MLAIVLATLAVAYLAWKITESPSQSVQFAFNGLSVGAVYALLAMGFTLVYSTVWFFDLYYGAAAALGAYGVFYMRHQEVIGAHYQIQNTAVDVVFAAVVAGVVAWALYEILYPRLQGPHEPKGNPRGRGVYCRRVRRVHGARADVHGQHAPAVRAGGGPGHRRSGGAGRPRGAAARIER